MTHQTDEFITCHSCDFRYPLSRGLCVMCGVPARTAAPVQASSEIAPSPNESDHTPEETISGESLSQPIARQDSKKSVGIGIALTVVLLMPLFLVIRNWQASKSTGLVAAVVNTQPLSSSDEIPAPGCVAKKPAKKVHTAVPARQQAAAAAPPASIPATQDDPTELWKSVRGGNPRAEVTLAKLYLEGNEVPQSCEQTHMLLLAASKKGYKPADSLLTGAYVERCQQR